MNTEVFEPIETPLGILSGRDAIFLDETQCDMPSLILRGAFSGSLSSKGRKHLYYDYSLTFFQVQALRVLELDWAEAIYTYKNQNKGQSSFDEVLHSSWLASLQADATYPLQVIDKCKHYRIWTYDHMFDVICSHYELTIQLDNPHQ